MIDKELQMESSSYSIVNDRICLLTNNLPPNELKDDDNHITAALFLDNLSLKRKNKRFK